MSGGGGGGRGDGGGGKSAGSGASGWNSGDEPGLVRVEGVDTGVVRDALAEVSLYAAQVCAPGMGSSKVRQLCDIFQRLEDLIEGRLLPPTPPPAAAAAAAAAAVPARPIAGPAVVLGGRELDEVDGLTSESPPASPAMDGKID